MLKPFARKLLLLSALLTTSACLLSPDSNKWRMQFSGGSDTTGVIIVNIIPNNSAPITIEINVPSDLSENEVAEQAMNFLAANLPNDIYHVERDDGEDVLVKRRMGAENFELVIVSNTVEGVRINLDKE
jgi:hypothetical protein